MIIGHLIFNIHSLRTCSLTCYSWYIVAAPHLHHTLVTQSCSWDRDRDWKIMWPRPLFHMHRLGLLPLVKKLNIHEGALYDPSWFSPTRFDCYTLRQFFTLTNVQELGIEFLDIPKFMPRLRRYFGHFSPTLRSLALREPKGSRRQIIYFIGLFQHLDNLKLLFGPPTPNPPTPNHQEEPVDDRTPTPLFFPPLRGRLTLMFSRGVGLLKDMIVLSGGVRFHSVDIFEVNGMPLLLGACAATLKTLRLYPTDFRGKHLSLRGM